jgi:hypothetical protein
MIFIVIGILLCLVALLVAKLAALWIIGILFIVGGFIWLLVSGAGAAAGGRSRYGRWY